MARAKMTLLCGLLLIGVGGCAELRLSRQLDYRTVQANPRHDTDRAQRENERAVRLLENGKTERAEHLLQQALIADVTYGPAHNNLGRMYFDEGKYYLAAWEFEYAIKLMPEKPEPLQNLGMVYEAVNKYDLAVECFAAAYRMQPDNPQVIGNLARAHLARGDDVTVVLPLLQDLLFYDTRPEWTGWARELLALGERRPPHAVMQPNLETVPTPTPGWQPPGALPVPQNLPQGTPPLVRPALPPLEAPQVDLSHRPGTPASGVSARRMPELRQ